MTAGQNEFDLDGAQTFNHLSSTDLPNGLARRSSVSPPQAIDRLFGQLFRSRVGSARAVRQDHCSSRRNTPDRDHVANLGVHNAVDQCGKGIECAFLLVVVGMAIIGAAHTRQDVA